MQPDSITQLVALALVQAGLPAPLAALTACLALIAVPLFVGVTLVAIVEAVGQRRAGRKVGAALRGAGLVGVPGH